MHVLHTNLVLSKRNCVSLRQLQYKCKIIPWWRDFD